MKKKKNGIYIAIICALIAICGFVIINYEFSFIEAPNSFVKIGTDVTIYASNNSSSSTALVFDGSYLPNDKYNQRTKIVIPTNINQSVLRAKSYVVEINGEQTDGILHTSTNWVFCPDGYYYYQPKVNGGEIINLTRSVVLPKKHYDSLSYYNLIIMVEMYEYNEASMQSVLIDTPEQIKDIWNI